MGRGDDEDGRWSESDFNKALNKARTLRAEATAWQEDITAASASQRREEINQIKAKIKGFEAEVEAGHLLREEADRLTDAYDKQLLVLKSQEQVFGRIKQEAQVTLNRVLDFVQSTAVQYNYAQKLAKEYKAVGRDLGANAAMGERLNQSFKNGLSEVEMMGGSMEDITNIMTSFADQSGRMSILDKEDLQSIDAFALGTNMLASDAAGLAETFDLMGMSTEGMSQTLMDTYKESQKLGLNANKVMKVLQSNMKTMQSYSFGGGVKGMTEMAKQAVKMRVDVSDVLSMADKFYQPEAAIEAAANLQMLGGDIAEAFGDPFETMYLARNKPQELADRLGKMTENMMTFNDETGQYEFPAEVRMQLKSAGEQLGINTEKMVEMARQSSKLKDLKMKFTALGDEEQIGQLSSLAKWSDDAGEFVIKHDGKELGLDEINKGMAEDILQANQPDSETFKDIAIHTQTMSEQFASLNEAMMARVVGETNLYEVTAKHMEEKLLEPLKGNLNKLVDNAIDAMDFEKMFDSADWSDPFEEAGDNMELYNTAVKKGITTFEELDTAMDNLFTKISAKKLSNMEGDNKIAVLPDGDQNDFISRPGQPIQSFVGEDTLMGAKAGGPIDKLLNTSIGGGTGSMVSGSIDVNFNNAVITLKSSSGEVAMDMNKIKDAIQPIIINALNNKSRNGGVLSSKEAVDNGLTV